VLNNYFILKIPCWKVLYSRILKKNPSFSLTKFCSMKKYHFNISEYTTNSVKSAKVLWNTTQEHSTKQYKKYCQEKNVETQHIILTLYTMHIHLLYINNHISHKMCIYYCYYEYWFSIIITTCNLELWIFFFHYQYSWSLEQGNFLGCHERVSSISSVQWCNHHQLIIKIFGYQNLQLCELHDDGPSNT
jgi:hypothetical protein